MPIAVRQDPRVASNLAGLVVEAGLIRTVAGEDWCREHHMVHFAVVGRHMEKLLVGPHRAEGIVAGPDIDLVEVYCIASIVKDFDRRLCTVRIRAVVWRMIKWNMMAYHVVEFLAPVVCLSCHQVTLQAPCSFLKRTTYLKYLKVYSDNLPMQ